MDFVLRHFWTPGYLLLLVFVLQPVVSEAVEGDRSSVGGAVVLWVFVPLQQWRYSPSLLYRSFNLRGACGEGEAVFVGLATDDRRTDE